MTKCVVRGLDERHDNHTLKWVSYPGPGRDPESKTMNVLQAGAAMALAIFATGLRGEPAQPPVPSPTAREIIAAIQHEIPISWDEPTVDTFKAGNPEGRCRLEREARIHRKARLGCLAVSRPLARSNGRWIWAVQ